MNYYRQRDKHLEFKTKERVVDYNFNGEVRLRLRE